MSKNYILSHIVAASANNVIGVDGELPWDIPEDMKFFRTKTSKKIIIMGRKTFESVGHPLPNRLNIVISRQENYKADGADVFTNLTDAIEFAKTKTDEYDSEIFIIGGGEIYKQSLSLIDKVYLTRIHKTIEGDAHYPDTSENEFKVVDKSDRQEPVPFSFLTYERFINN